METEQDRLQKLYGEMGDRHLLDMAEQPEDLTDGARLALTHELRRRGLVAAPPPEAPIVATIEPEREQGFGAGMPGIFPGAAAAVEQALEAARPRQDGLTNLISFYDGTYLTQACEVLESHDIQPVIEPIAGDAMHGVPPRFEIWLEAQQIEPAKSLLRQEMGLFPPAEVESDPALRGEDTGTGLVAVFESANEAEEARAMLAAKLIEARVLRNADEESGATSWEVVVEPAEQEHAIAVVAAGMGLG